MLVTLTVWSKRKKEWHKIFHGNAAEDMADLAQCLGWDEKGYPMDMPRSGKPKLQITSHSKAEMNEWEASLDDFDQRQSNFTKETFKGKPSKNGMTAGTGKEMYWVGLVPYLSDYSDRCRHST